MILIDNSIFEIFARGGGGGSGGGGGGGGGSGGGGSGGGGILAFLVFLGYIPMQWIGSKFRSWDQVLLGSFVLWPLSIVAIVVLTWTLSFYGTIIGCGAMAGVGSGLYGWLGKAIKRAKKTKALLKTAAAKDPEWDEANIIEKTKTSFLKFQNDWMNSDIGSIKTYTTERYHNHTALMLQALKLAGRKNVMTDVTIISQDITSMNDVEGVRGDSVTVGFEARAVDSIVEMTSEEILYTDSRSFIEYWTFLRDDQGWKLDQIDQDTAAYYLQSQQLKAFASANNYFYSPDWGWLLLPKKGQLFGKGKFGTSDINNHIIGSYQDSLVQLYTYQPNPNSDSSGMKYYLIAQANVQKTYGNIVVRRKKFLQMGIDGLQKIETEWTAFNKNYEVYASSSEGAASFELLEPTFMEKLNALSFEVNIEVVDNVVYLYSREKNVNPAHYQEMLDILHEAYTYMKR